MLVAGVRKPRAGQSGTTVGWARPPRGEGACQEWQRVIVDEEGNLTSRSRKSKTNFPDGGKLKTGRVNGGRILSGVLSVKSVAMTTADGRHQSSRVHVGCCLGGGDIPRHQGGSSLSHDSGNKVLCPVCFISFISLIQSQGSQGLPGTRPSQRPPSVTQGCSGGVRSAPGILPPGGCPEPLPGDPPYTLTLSRGDGTICSILFPSNSVSKLTV